MRVASELEKLYELSFYKDRTREWISIELVKGMVTGKMPEIGKTHRVGPQH